jgi:hypothetical protein
MAIGDISTFGQVLDAAGEQRLSLLYREVSDRGFDFHALVWERRSGGEWAVHRTITQDDFVWRYPFRRWIAGIHGFDGLPNRAIIRVGELPSTSGSGVVGYSWRIWNLESNTEEQFVRLCKNPSEPYEG